jgi:hypothetical protein
MALWAKLKIFYKTALGSIGSTLVASTTETDNDYDVSYLHNFKESDFWKSNDTAVPMYITLNAGIPVSVDYLAILGHNLNTIGATITLQYSIDNFAADINDIFVAEAPTADTVYLKEFDTQSKQYWRLKITGSLSAVPYMAICVWGESTELDYSSTPFDPDSRDKKATVNLSHGGYVTGVHEKYTERSLTLTFDDAIAALYTKIDDLYTNHGFKNFFIAPDLTNSPTKIYLMYMSDKFDAPYTANGLYRSITVMKLKGRQE